MNEMMEPGDELLELCLDLRSWAEVHGAEAARLRPETDHALPAAQVVEPTLGPVKTTSAASTSSAPTVPTFQSLAQLSEQAQGCTQCDLHHERAQVVFGCGDAQADLMFVGLAPGREEDLQGAPFVGEAGGLLDRIVGNVLGLNRSEVYICNVVKCRPPDDRAPETGEVGACSAFLRQQLDSVGPVVVVALGERTAQVLLQSSQGLSQLRGQPHAFQDSVLLATHHPEELLRAPQFKRDVFEDMKLLRRTYRERTGKELPAPMKRGG